MPHYEDVSYEVSDGIARVAFARPEKRNALRVETMRECCAALDEAIADDGVRAIVLAGEGEHFAVGADYDLLAEMNDLRAAEVRRRIYEHFQGAARRLYTAPKPTVAAVQGAAVTVGAELALACDFRVMAEGSFLQESWVKLGLVPPLGGLFLLPRYLGLAKAREVVLRNKRIYAADALADGLASEVVPPGELADAARRLAEELMAIAPMAYFHIKEGLHRGLETSMAAEWSANVSVQGTLITSEDFAEGLAAMRDKRPARFAGR